MCPHARSSPVGCRPPGSPIAAPTPNEQLLRKPNPTKKAKMHLAHALRRSPMRPFKAQQLLVRNMSAATVKPNGLELYREKYARSLEPEYWGEIAAKNFHWEQPFSDKNILSYNFKKSEGAIFVKWFEDGKTNICFNAVDRWAKECPDKTALIYEGNDGESRRMSFSELLSKVCQVANVLQQTCGVQKGDRVAMYMPMTLELPITMLACARIGAFTLLFLEALARKLWLAASWTVTRRFWLPQTLLCVVQKWWS